MNHRYVIGVYSLACPRPAFTFVATLVVLVSLLVSACSGSIKRPDDALTSTRDVVAAIDSRLEAVQDVRIAAKVDYYDEERGERVVARDVSLSAAAPASLRVTLSSFDKALASLASDGTDFSMLNLQENVYYHGPATVENLSQLFPLFLSGADFVRVLRGGFPIELLADGWREKTELGWNQETGRYRLEVATVDGGLQLVELTYPELGVAQIEIKKDGESLYTYEGKDFQSPGVALFPVKSRFTLVERDTDVTLRVEGFDANVEPNERIFKIPPPAGAKVVDLSL
ncbi:MAG: hypothetical protein CO108_10290 [Deltaproteobacteria bacterium CG_4_9_14_3_um_filter_63_12]|nr:MAG: hypothetical protein CO108_10290 [Deltaproteobacteria bacterium CG_4_9_14_3_um_filter_63_12]